MVGLILALAVLNITAAAACWLLLRVWFVDPPPVAVKETDESASQADATGLNLPAAWDKQLTRARVKVHSIIEGGVHIVEMDLDRYEAELHDIIDLVQAASGSCDDLELASQSSRLQTLVEQRLPELESTAEQLERRKDEDTQLRRYSNQLAEALTDELADLSDAVHKISHLNFARDAQQAGDTLCSELDRILELTGELRSLTDGMLSEVRSLHYEPDEFEADLGSGDRFMKLHQSDVDGSRHTAIVDTTE